LGAVTSRPSFESSLRAISRIRPRARKIRRRLTALAGAIDKTTTGKNDDIVTAVLITSKTFVSERGSSVIMIKNAPIRPTTITACSLSLANRIVTIGGVTNIDTKVKVLK
jgi:hypothetical protein